MNIFSSNNRLDYERKPPKFLDILTNIGGMAGSIAFIISLFYSWYNKIAMEQTLLNYGILNLRDDTSPSDWEKGRFFSFCEIFFFKVGSPIFGSLIASERYQFYKRCLKLFNERTDIVNIMRNV